MTININETVYVWLTPRGQGIVDGEFRIAYTGEGRALLFAQLWDLMRVFGSHMQMGLGTLFEGNAIHSYDTGWNNVYEACLKFPQGKPAKEGV